MASDPVTFALQTPGHLSFPSTHAFAKNFHHGGGRVALGTTGHLVFYQPDGHRVLATDPGGHPLHECEWHSDADGRVSLARARIRLDWGQWIGLKPGGLVNKTRLNLTTRPGWQRITSDDLRAMAAQAMRVPIEDVRWFFHDDDLTIDASGVATIRHRKDALYVLDQGTFAQARFMACMGAMHWDHIDFLPVVELFKSLLPGTGSAVFELIRGLYDDQYRTQALPHTLRYRGIPPYPSEAAFRLFSQFFTPSVSGGGEPLTVFMDQSRAHRVTWLPVSDPPIRYFDAQQGLCLTVQGRQIQKVTVTEDPAGLPCLYSPLGQPAPFDRSLRVKDGQLILRDRDHETIFTLGQGIAEASAFSASAIEGSVDWRTLFAGGVPPIRPADAFGAVLLYPDNDDEIGEIAAQPFVADYLQDAAETDREIAAVLSHAEQVLIDNGDAVLSTCVLFDRPRDYVVRSVHAAYAQRHAQQLWMQSAAIRRWEWLKRIRIVPASMWEETRSGYRQVDLAYQWVSYDSFGSTEALTAEGSRLGQCVRSGGHAFVIGPAEMRDMMSRSGWHLMWEEPVDSLPTFRMHKTILPQARLKAGLTLFHLRRS
ncbi:MAG: hypothetical protein FJ247_08375 [Nitrospira sp.]|nr:hypothetical protein [Nitrospira sp.]